MSMPIYFPPPPFDLSRTLVCGHFVDAAYDMYSQWKTQGTPRDPTKFAWQKPTAPEVTFSAPIWSHTKGPLHLRSKSEPFGFTVWNATGDAWVVLRGTDTVHDWLMDAEARHTPFTYAESWGSVHDGFNDLYGTLRDNLMAAMQEAPQGIKRWFITGHSLGAALSTLALADLAAQATLALAEHCNFASPRVCDPGFTAKLNALSVPSFRVVNTEDVVPTLPSSVRGSANYQHIGTPVVFTAQHGSVDANHSMSGSYLCALEHPNDPAGPAASAATTA